MALIITADGIDALASAESTGVKLQATHMAVGDGNGNAAAHTSESPSLINERWRGELQEIKKKNAGEVEFTAHVPFTVGDWYVREVAIYAGDVLLAIGSHPEVWKPAPEAPDKLELLICAPVVFGNTDNISVTVDSTKVLASQEHVAEEIAKHNDSGTAHAGVFDAVAAHIGDKNNPHDVTPGIIGAAAADHTHGIPSIRQAILQCPTKNGLPDFLSSPLSSAVHDIFGDASILATFGLNGTAGDSGGAYDGVWSGVETYELGHLGQAASFDGASGIIASTFPQLGFDTPKAASLWFNTVSTDLSETILQIVEGSTNRYTLGISNGYVSCHKANNNTSYGFNFPALNDGQWHHIVGQYDGAGTISVYIDGVFAYSGGGVGQSSSNSFSEFDGLGIGINAYSVNSRNFNGKVDQVRIFNRILTADEVSALYNESAATGNQDVAIKCSSDNPLAVTFAKGFSQDGPVDVFARYEAGKTVLASQLTISARNYIYINEDGTVGASITPPEYGFAKTGTGDFFDLNSYTMFDAAASPVARVYIGYVDIDGAGSIANSYCYAPGAYAVREVNGGADITINSRYVEENPFGINTPVLVEAEVSKNNRWTFPGWVYFSTVVSGVRAHYIQGEGVVVQTAKDRIWEASNRTGDGAGDNSTAIVTSALCRVKFRRIF